MINYKAMTERIQKVKTLADAQKIGPSLDRLYNAGLFTPNELQKLDIMLTDKQIELQKGIDGKIAEFIGLSSQNRGGGYMLYEHPINGNYTNAECLDFHSRWDCLMLAVEKIAPPNGWEIEGITLQAKVLTALQSANISRTYDAVCVFVQWYHYKNN